jgi:hypothetical protein
MEKQSLHSNGNLASLKDEYIVAKFDREDAAVRRKPVVLSDLDLDLIGLKKSKVKVAKSANATGEMVESVFAVRRTGKKLFFQAIKVDGGGESVTLSATQAEPGGASRVHGNHLHGVNSHVTQSSNAFTCNVLVCREIERGLCREVAVSPRRVLGIDAFALYIARRRHRLRLHRIERRGISRSGALAWTSFASFRVCRP